MEERPPKEAGEDWVSVRDYGGKQPMKLEDIGQKDPCHRCCCIRMGHGRKCPYLVSRSITTNMIENPCDTGRLSMKSIEMSDQMREGMGKG